ncbi:MAG TPA: hypothetical protein VNY05_03795 [Candidatus Acidoferrales bacterium]|nr:hypothetical protein [Candidatus Acidoferrales bacterium]
MGADTLGMLAAGTGVAGADVQAGVTTGAAPGAVAVGGGGGGGGDALSGPGDIFSVASGDILGQNQSDAYVGELNPKAPTTVGYSEAQSTIGQEATGQDVGVYDQNGNLIQQTPQGLHSGFPAGYLGGAGIGPAFATPASGDISQLRQSAYADALNDPTTAQHFANSIKAEVGFTDPAQAQGYVDQLLNRGIARDQSLNAAATDPAYFPGKTGAQLNDPVSAANMQAATNYFQNSMQGTNTSSVPGVSPTGNASNEPGDMLLSHANQRGEIVTSNFNRDASLTGIGKEGFLLENNPKDQAFSDAANSGLAFGAGAPDMTAVAGAPGTSDFAKNVPGVSGETASSDLSNPSTPLTPLTPGQGADISDLLAASDPLGTPMGPLSPEDVFGVQSTAFTAPPSVVSGPEIPAAGSLAPDPSAPLPDPSAVQQQADQALQRLLEQGPSPATSPPDSLFAGGEPGARVVSTAPVSPDSALLALDNNQSLPGEWGDLPFTAAPLTGGAALGAASVPTVGANQGYAQIPGAGAFNTAPAPTDYETPVTQDAPTAAPTQIPLPPPAPGYYGGLNIDAPQTYGTPTYPVQSSTTDQPPSAPPAATPAPAANAPAVTEVGPTIQQQYNVAQRLASLGNPYNEPANQNAPFDAPAGTAPIWSPPNQNPATVAGQMVPGQIAGAVAPTDTTMAPNQFTLAPGAGDVLAPPALAAPEPGGTPGPPSSPGELPAAGVPVAGVPTSAPQNAAVGANVAQNAGPGGSAGAGGSAAGFGGSAGSGGRAPPPVPPIVQQPLQAASSPQAASQLSQLSPAEQQQIAAEQASLINQWRQVFLTEGIPYPEQSPAWPQVQALIQNQVNQTIAQASQANTGQSKAA